MAEDFFEEKACEEPYGGEIVADYTFVIVFGGAVIPWAHISLFEENAGCVLDREKAEGIDDSSA